MTKKTSGRNKLMMSLGLLAAVIISYANALVAAFVHYDHRLILDNPSVRQLNYIPNLFTEGIWENFIIQNLAYRPLQITSYSIDWLLWGDEAFGYHLSSLILHILVVFALWKFLNILLPKYKYLPWIVSLIYAVHPVNTEVVTYISARSFSLLALFSLLSFIFWHIYKEKKLLKYHIFSIIAFLLALLSHEAAILLPLGWLLFDLYQAWQSGGKKQLSLKQYIPGLALLVIYIISRFTFLSFAEFSPDHSLFTRVLGFMSMVWEYLGLSFTPLWLSLDHSESYITGLFSFWQLVSLVIWLVIIAISFRFLNTRPHITFGVLWMVLWLLPFSGILPIDPILREAHLYLPLMGGILAFTGLFEIIFEKFLKDKNRKVLAAILVILIVIGSSALVIRRNMAFASEKELYLNELKVNPNSYEINTALARVYLIEEDWHNTKIHLDKALNKNPEYLPAILHSALLYLDTKEPEKALTYFKKANELVPEHPIILYSIGKTLTRTGDGFGATEYLEKAIKLSPDNGEINRELALAYAKTLRYDEAEHYFKKALKLNPADAMSYFYLAGIYQNERLYQEAVTNFSKAVALEPDNHTMKLYLKKAQELLDKEREKILNNK